MKDLPAAGTRFKSSHLKNGETCTVTRTARVWWSPGLDREVGPQVWAIRDGGKTELQWTLDNWYESATVEAA